jgi:hypothetical protein
LNVSSFTGPRVDTDFTIPAPGIYTIEVSMREDGTDIDALLLDSTGTFTGGSQIGPPESAFAIMPIPEPSTLLIWSLLAGLGIGAGWRRRERRRPL